MRIRLIACICVVALIGLSTAANAKPMRHQTEPKPALADIPPVMATYDVYVGGVRFISADVHFVEQGGKYSARVNAHTTGFWYRLFPWDSLLQTEGTLRGDHFVPAEFLTHDAWGKKVKTTKLHFLNNGDIQVEFDPPQNVSDHEAISAGQKRGALDPVTGLLQLIAHVAVAHDCNVTVPIFDGKILFNITGNDKGAEDTDPDDYGVYKGSARACDADFDLIAGEWKEKTKNRFWYKNDHEKGREPFHIWMASPDMALPELPVRLESGSVWGLVVIHLSALKHEPVN